VRAAVRRFLTTAGIGQGQGQGAGRTSTVAVACSGGADSLALAAATVHCAGKLGLAAHGLVVDHQLQPDSARVAQAAAQALRQLGCTAVRVLQVTVVGPGGPEAAAPRAP
jgi:tRNA(Ile)-lysidine synthase